MDKQKKFSLIYLLTLLPLTVIAVAWPLLELSLRRPDYRTILVGAVMVGAASRLRIRLPKTNSHLALSDALILLSLLYFGGEYAVLMSLPAALVTNVWDLRKRPKLQLLTNICITVITVFVTSIGILALFGQPDAVLIKLGSWTFVL